METLDAHTLSQKLDTVFGKLKCAAKLNVVFDFVLKNAEDWTFRFYYAQGDNTSMERSKLAATEEESKNVKSVSSIIVVIEASTEERTNVKWNFYKLTNVTVFAALLGEVPMGNKNAVLPKNHTVNCSSYGENTRKPYVWQSMSL